MHYTVFINNLQGALNISCSFTIISDSLQMIYKLIIN